MQKYGLCLCPITVRGHYIVNHSFAQRWGGSSTCTLLSLECPSRSPSLSLPGFQLRHNAMMGFSDGIEISSHSCHPCKLHCLRILSLTKTSSQLLSDAFSFLFLLRCHHGVIIRDTAASLVNLFRQSSFNPSLCLHFSEGLPPLLHGLLQYLQYSHTVRAAVYRVS